MPEDGSPRAGSPQLPRLLSRRSSISRVFGAYEGGVLCSPIWYGIIALFLEIFPSGMTMSLLNKLQTDQFGANLYWMTTGSLVLMALLSAPGLAFGGYFSQPHRCGRKTFMLVVMCISTLTTAVPAITTNAYTILLVKLVVSVTGVGSSNTPLFVTVLSWATDWCDPEDKPKYFGILMGCLFGTISFSSYIPKVFGIEKMESIFLFAALAKLAGPLFVLTCFPKSIAPTGDGIDPTSPSSLSRRFSSSPASAHEEPSLSADAQPPDESQQPTGLRKSLRTVCSSTKYLFKAHCSATCIYLMISFCDSAVQDTIFAFMIKERHLTVPDLNALILVIGIFGFLLQCIVMPAATACGIRPVFFLVLGVAAMIVHFAVYAWCANKWAIILLEPIGSCGYLAQVAATAIVSGVSRKGIAVPRDQGTLLGTLYAYNLLASCVGPLILAACTTYYTSLPSPFNWPGLGFAVLSVVMVLGLVLAVRQYCKKDLPQPTNLVSSEDAIFASSDNSLLKPEAALSSASTQASIA